ncbi:MAG TPA: hypothetical protein VGE40_10495 [Bacilli bacterium]
MKIFKKFSFWMTLFASIVNLFHFLGYDGDNYLIFFANPPNWVLEDYSYKLREFFVYERAFWVFLYIINIGFYFLSGCIIDWLISKIKKARSVHLTNNDR